MSRDEVARFSGPLRKTGRWLASLAELSPLTLRGLLVGILAAVFLWTHGYGALDLVLFVVGVSGLALVALCLLTVAVAAFRVQRSRLGSDQTALDRGALEAGVPHERAALLRTTSREAQPL